MSLEYEPASEALHISVKQLFSYPACTDAGAMDARVATRPTHISI
jgi:hypothetical protein